MPPAKAQGLSLERNRSWCFTLYAERCDETPPAIDFVPSVMKYLVYQLERCPESKQLHQQGFVTFTQPKSFRAAKLALGFLQMHLEVARHVKRSIEYCKKEATRVAGPWIFGSEPAQGQRADLKGLAELAAEGASTRDIALAYPESFIRMHKGIAAFRSAIMVPTTNSFRKAVLLWGETGVGKTRWAHERSKEGAISLYTVFDTKTPWFDGYEGEKWALFDDVGVGAVCNYNVLKRLTDIYPMRVPVKGGSIIWNPDVIILTSNTNMWTDWWPDIPWADQAALDRRIIKFKMPDETEELNQYIFGTRWLGPVTDSPTRFQLHQDPTDEGRLA